MDEALQLFESGNGQAGIERIVQVLAQARQNMTTAAWHLFSRSIVSHPVVRYLHADPMTFRAFAKPRGYAGDAVMMDFIYGLEQAVTAGVVSGITHYTTTNGLSPRAVRHRRQVLASAIDEVATERGVCSVTALAAGHLRELPLSAAAAQGQVTIRAIDQDEASLALVNREYAHLGVVPMRGSVREILMGRVLLPPAHLAYAAGLFDYLTDAVAERLTVLLFASVAPGGRLLLANFLPSLPDAGYMESFMDWHLVYRTDAQMRALTDALPQSDIARIRQYQDPFGAVTYLEVTRAPGT